MKVGEFEKKFETFKNIGKSFGISVTKLNEIDNDRAVVSIGCLLNYIVKIESDIEAPERGIIVDVK